MDFVAPIVLVPKEFAELMLSKSDMVMPARKKNVSIEWDYKCGTLKCRYCWQESRVVQVASKIDP